MTLTLSLGTTGCWTEIAFFTVFFLRVARKPRFYAKGTEGTSPRCQSKDTVGDRNVMIKPSRVPLVQHDAIFPLSEGFVLTEEAGEKQWIFPLSPTRFLSWLAVSSCEMSDFRLEAENWTISNDQINFDSTLEGTSDEMSPEQSRTSVAKKPCQHFFSVCFIIQWELLNRNQPYIFENRWTRIKLEHFWNKLEPNWYFIRSKSLVKIKCVVM